MGEINLENSDIGREIDARIHHNKECKIAMKGLLRDSNIGGALSYQIRLNGLSSMT